MVVGTFRHTAELSTFHKRLFIPNWDNHQQCEPRPPEKEHEKIQVSLLGVLELLVRYKGKKLVTNIPAFFFSLPSSRISRTCKVLQVNVFIANSTLHAYPGVPTHRRRFMFQMTQSMSYAHSPRGPSYRACWSSRSWRSTRT